MDICTLNRAKTIQEELNTLKREKGIWEDAKEFGKGIMVFDGCEIWDVEISLIDFKELKNRTLAYINSQIEVLEKEFKEL